MIVLQLHGTCSIIYIWHWKSVKRFEAATFEVCCFSQTSSIRLINYQQWLQLWVLSFRHRVTVISCAIQVCACVYTCSIWKRYCGLFFSFSVVFVFVFICLLIFWWCRRKIVNAQNENLVWHGSCLKSAKNKSPNCWWKVWKEIFLCDGLTVVIVMMHLLSFSFSHYVEEIEKHSNKDYLNDMLHVICLLCMSNWEIPTRSIGYS